MDNYKKHKIPGYDIAPAVCCKEQVFAYNYLFSWTLNEHEKDYALSCIKRELDTKAAGTYNEIYKPFHPWKKGGADYMLVYQYIISSWDRYTSGDNITGRKNPIFSDYATLASVIY